MSRVASIRRELEAARDQTLRLCARITEVDFRRQIHREFSPIGWHLGHIGVTEAYWVLQQCKGEPPLSAAYDRLFTPTDTPKPERVHLPARGEIFAYLGAVRERVLNFLTNGACDPGHPLLRDARIFNMLLQHEEQYQETMSLILRLLAAERYDSSPVSAEGWGEGWSQPELDERPPHLSPLARGGREISPPSDQDMIAVPAGPFVMGSDDLAHTLDNERPQQAVLVPAFLIDRHPVTNAEFLSFVAGGGYQEPSYWSAEGWRWRERSKVEHPLYWRQHGGGWVEIGLYGSAPLPPHHPVQCVSWYEADAYARWLGKRLPSEEEWEKAAAWDPERGEKRPYPWGEREPDSSTCTYAAAGEHGVGQHAAGRSPYGCEDMLGNVWEWTATWFQPYRGFAAFPYEGYSVPYFDGQHRVLRGGSWATRRHVLRPTFRNWYQPWVREIFAGFRCAKDL